MGGPSVTVKKTTEYMRAVIKHLEQRKSDSIANLHRSVLELHKYKYYCQVYRLISQMKKLDLVKTYKGLYNSNIITLNKSSELYRRIKKNLPFDGINKAVNRQVVYQYARSILARNRKPNVLILGGPYLHDIPEILKHNNQATIDSVECNMHSYVCAAIKARAAYRDNVEVHHANIHDYLLTTNKTYDLIYLDYCGKIKEDEANTIKLALNKLSHGGQLAITTLLARATTKYLRDKSSNQLEAVWQVIKEMAEDIKYYPVATIKYHDVVAMSTVIIHKGFQSEIYDEIVVKYGQVKPGED